MRLSLCHTTLRSSKDARFRDVVELYKAMSKDKLESSTVRFTDSDLYLIASLRDKLGLGIGQVLRLAIRRLAELENVMPRSDACTKG